MKTHDNSLVLIVDDEPAVRRSLAAALTAGGFRIIEASGGAEAIAMLEGQHPDAIVLDLVMPGVDGFALCSAVRGTARGELLPLIVLTAHDDPQSIERAYDAGATDFLTKPFNASVLVHRVRYLLRTARALADARDGERRLWRAQRMARVSGWELAVDSGTFSLSEGMRELFGMIPGGPPHCTWDEFLAPIHSSDRASVESAMKEAIERHASCRIEFRLLMPDGAERMVNQETEIVRDDESWRVMGTVQDITAVRQAENRITKLAYFDSLTGLPNRTFLREQLTRALAEAKRYNRSMAILGVDLDLFKRVNDTLGHAAGDRLLKQVSSRLKRVLRNSDTLGHREEAGGLEPRAADTIARMGADEFMAVLSEVRNPMDASIVAQRILAEMAQPFLVERQETFVSASIGIVSFPGDGEDVDVLLRNVDLATHHAKEAGGNGFKFFTKTMNEQVHKRIAIETGMRLGLERGEFILFYQPRINLRTGGLESVEALIRWRHPERGLVPPMDFIPVSEETGLIVPLGAWVLRAALLQTKAWQQQLGRRIPVAVNVSARQFREPDLVEVIKHILQETEVETSLLQIEITEGVVMQDTGASSKALQEMRALGIKIALDDFGTGYSSLSYLTRFPIDILKVDRSFVQNLMASKTSATITAAIVALSRSLELDVCAEGIETQEQLEFLRREGCQEGQGFLFAKPLPAEDLIRWLIDREQKALQPPLLAVSA